MKTRVPQGLKGLVGVVSLIEDQGDVLAALRQLTVTLAQFLTNGLELGSIVEVACIDLVKERDMKIGADQHPQINLPQVGTLLFVMPPRRQGGWVGGVDIGEEIGAIVDQGAQRQLEALDQALGQGVFDGGNIGFRNEVQWFQNAWLVNCAGVAGNSRSRAVCWYQSARRALLVGWAARLIAAKSKYCPTDRPWSRLGN